MATTCEAAQQRLGLDLRVFHLDPEISAGQRTDMQAVDADGHFVSYLMAPMPREALCQVSIPRGLDVNTAATVLRKLADRIERHGAELLTLERDQLGHFDADGTPIAEDPGYVETTPATNATESG